MESQSHPEFGVQIDFDAEYGHRSAEVVYTASALDQLWYRSPTHLVTPEDIDTFVVCPYNQSIIDDVNRDEHTVRKILEQQTRCQEISRSLFRFLDNNPETSIAKDRARNLRGYLAHLNAADMTQRDEEEIRAVQQRIHKYERLERQRAKRCRELGERCCTIEMTQHSAVRNARRKIQGHDKEIHPDPTSTSIDECVPYDAKRFD